jgi:hypothetical protein
MPARRKGQKVQPDAPFATLLVEHMRLGQLEEARDWDRANEQMDSCIIFNTISLSSSRFAAFQLGNADEVSPLPVTALSGPSITL